MRSVFVALIAIVIPYCSFASGTAVVTDGQFTNVYVYPDPSRETWEHHIRGLRADAAEFSRANIDRFTDTIMTPEWPSYFDTLYQYNRINPPHFFGSGVVKQECIDAAMRDLKDGVMQADTIRSLANCHADGKDPSPQINLIFSPDIKLSKYNFSGTSGDMCIEGKAFAWHGGGLDVPNFTVVPTDPNCSSSFRSFTVRMSHEIVETLASPGGFGVSNVGVDEVGDKCEDRADGTTTWKGFLVQTIWSDSDNTCEPKYLEAPAGSVSQIWILGEGSPFARLTGDRHTLSLTLPSTHPITGGGLTSAALVIKTGGDNLRGGHDNADATLNFAPGTYSGPTRPIRFNINTGHNWDSGQTHYAALSVPPTIRVSDITGVDIMTHFGGGTGGENWDIEKVALMVSFPSGSAVRTPVAPPIEHTWLDTSELPLVRFSGALHEFRINVPRIPIADEGVGISYLRVYVYTGNDDLRGGSDNADLVLDLHDGHRQVLRNINGGRAWAPWTVHEVGIPTNFTSPSSPTPITIRGGDISSLNLMTGFGGGSGGENWNVQRVKLVATITPPPPPAPAVHNWLDSSGAPLVRFTNLLHDWSMAVPHVDEGRSIMRLQVTITTGSHPLLGGRNPGDNCDLALTLANGHTIAIPNINAGMAWAVNSSHTVDVPIQAPDLPPAAQGGDIVGINLHTNFPKQGPIILKGGLIPRMWDVNRVQIIATVM